MRNSKHEIRRPLLLPFGIPTTSSFFPWGRVVSSYTPCKYPIFIPTKVIIEGVREIRQKELWPLLPPESQLQYCKRKNDCTIGPDSHSLNNNCWQCKGTCCHLHCLIQFRICNCCSYKLRCFGVSYSSCDFFREKLVIKDVCQIRFNDLVLLWHLQEIQYCIYTLDSLEITFNFYHHAAPLC